MKIRFKDLLVRPNHPKKLNNYKTQFKIPEASDENLAQRLSEIQKKISELQTQLYAGGTHAVLIIVQGMDTAGKDSVINGFLRGLHPNGYNVVPFKTPGPEALKHDFLWRSHSLMPERGQITVFNRSYYEEVLFPQVHPEFLAKENENFPQDPKNSFWKRRLKDIVQHEAYLNRQGTTIIKFFLNLSKDEQKKRLLRRIEDPHKNWKFNPQDIEERKHWDHYHKIYNWCINHSSTAEAPWYIIPADDKPAAKLLISEILLATLQSLKLSYPPLTLQQKKELKLCAHLLHKEKN